jgi:NAD(P)-dependent dehydrogenase (short-subunit alcohol dehydrogenase family)
VTLSGKVAVVTGASRGIGLAAAEVLAKAGIHVMICARSGVETARQVEAIGAKYPGKVSGVACDVRDENSVRDLMSQTVRTFGGLDVLVNNAGIGLLGPVETFSPAQWRETIDINLTGAFYCCHYAIPHLKARGGGDIINIASRSSINAYAGGAAYCASKFGMLGFSEALHLELRSENIRVSCLLPGRVSTEFAGEAPQDWHLSPGDVAEAIVDVLAFHPRAVASRIELRPARPPI